MTAKKRDYEKEIQKIIQEHSEMALGDLRNNFPLLPERSFFRILKKLIDQDLIKKEKRGRQIFYQRTSQENFKDYFQKPYFERPKKTFQESFLYDYIPNQSSFLGDRTESLLFATEKYSLQTQDYKFSQRQIENLLIDTSFASSALEGNTYSYLETEILIKYGQSSDERTVWETTMILNHKKAIEYILESRKQTIFSAKNFYELQSLLGKDLLEPQHLGKIRKEAVMIGGSSYTPPQDPHKLEALFQTFLEKLNQIKNPFEQSLFILVFIPYFQLFQDINKRTSRIGSNFPLLRAGLPPISLLQVNQKDYITAILAIYELNEVSLMADLFLKNYRLNMDRYK